MNKRIIVALDFPTLEQAANMSEALGDRFDFKVGKELNVAAGTPQVLGKIGAKKTFLDLKFHDIPNTVAGAVKAAARQGVWMLNVHALGGLEMMKAAAQARKEVFSQTGWRTSITAVTILTSHNVDTLRQMRIYKDMGVAEMVGYLTLLAYEAGLDGVVCSPQEIVVVRKIVPDDDFLVVTPGIRGKDAKPDDQKRTMTAGEAVDAGASHLVIGRPITAADNPLEAAEKFLTDIQ